MGNDVRLSEELKGFLDSYYRHTQKMMYAHAKKLATERELPPNAVNDIVQGGYANLAIQLASDCEVTELASSLILSPRKVGFYFIDEYVKEAMNEIADELQQSYVNSSIEQDFQDVTGNLTFGQNLIVDILSQRWGGSHRTDNDQRLSETQHLTRLEEQYIPLTERQPLSLDAQVIAVATPVEQGYDQPRITTSKRGVKYKGIRAPVLIK